ncbi:hypothetical protein [Ekhidna sp.]
MKYLTIIILITAFNPSHQTYLGDPDGYVIVKSDTIYGRIKVNFETGTITVKQDSINRMFLTDIHRIILNNKERETYILVTLNDRKTFYKILVDGKYPLATSEGVYFALVNKIPFTINSEKDLYEFFGKRDVKEYIFLRAINITEQEGLMDVFQYFNDSAY